MIPQDRHSLFLFADSSACQLPSYRSEAYSNMALHILKLRIRVHLLQGEMHHLIDPGRTYGQRCMYMQCALESDP